MPCKETELAPPDIYVLKGRVRVNQPATGGLRTSLDSVMLAAACKAQAGTHVLDLGCGVGAAGLCVLARVADTRVTGVDIIPDLIHLARDNAKTNGWEGRAHFIMADVLAEAFIPAQAPFDHVICNPPYLQAGTYTPSPDDLRAAALGHADQDKTLAHWLRVAHRCLKSRGSFTLIHRAEYLDQILEGLGPRFGAVEILPLWPRAGQPAKRVIVRAIKDRRGGVTLHPGLVLHEEGTAWTAAARAVLEEMGAL